MIHGGKKNYILLLLLPLITFDHMKVVNVMSVMFNGFLIRFLPLQNLHQIEKHSSEEEGGKYIIGEREKITNNQSRYK